MTKDIPQEFLDYLIAVGEGSRFDDCLQIPQRFPELSSGQVMRLHFSAWYEIAEPIESEKLAALIKAMTVTEMRVPHFGAGSVSPVIWLFRVLSNRQFVGLEILADWILAHSDNPYLPFGSYNFRAKSVAEYKNTKVRKAQERTERRIDESARQAQAARIKSDKATHNIFGALGRKDMQAVSALLMQGAKLDEPGPSGQTARQVAASMGLSHLLDCKISIKP